MADYYGSCTGKAGGKYNVWLSVVQNYQSIEGNFSNISIGLYLKRNDGYSDSAYNLNDLENQASIQVNGEGKAWRNLDIDTRGNATVVLAEWTGDIYHNPDGTLSLNVEGSFNMGNNNVSGGQAYGTFTCTTIPRKSQMTLSSTEIYPGGTVNCNVVSASAEFSHSINFYLEQTEGSIWLDEGVSSGAFFVPYEWAYQLPWTNTANIRVVLTTYCYGQFVGSETYSVSFVIPDTNDFKPTFDLAVERINNAVPAEWNVLLKGISGVKVDVANLNLKYGAVVVAVEARVGGSVYNGVPSWFYLLDSGNVEISVSVRDSRGFTYTATTTVYVMDYFAPSITINGVKRCNVNGELTEAGEYLLLDYNTHICSVDGKNNVRISYRLGTSGEDLGEEMFLEATPAIIGNGIVVPSRSYLARFTVYDSVYSWGVAIDRSIPSADVPFNIRKGGKGAAFGCYAEKDNELTVGWDLNIKGKIKSDDSLLTLSNEISYITDYSKVRNYPSLNTCFVNLGFIASVDIPEGVNFVVGYSKVKPIDFSPLSTIVWGYKPGQAYIDLHTNAIIFRSSEYIPAGVGIYINGSYTTN